MNYFIQLLRYYSLFKWMLKDYLLGNMFTPNNYTLKQVVDHELQNLNK